MTQRLDIRTRHVLMIGPWVALVLWTAFSLGRIRGSRAATAVCVSAIRDLGDSIRVRTR